MGSRFLVPRPLAAWSLGFSFWLVGWLGLAPAIGQDWTEFRGTDGNGHATATELPVQWRPQQFRWHTPLPGKGWSSPVVIDNEIWLTTAVEHGGQGGESAASGAATGLDLLVLSIDRHTGQIQQQVTAFSVPEPPALHPLNSYASPTPAIAGDRVVVSFGTMGAAAIRRADGKILWKNEEIHIDHETGPGSSPIIAGELAVIHYDGTDQQSIAALRLSDGTIAWQNKRSGEMHPQGMMKKAFSTSTLAEVGGRRVLVSPAANWLYGYDPATGAELWKLSYGKLGFSTVPRPILGPGMIYICTGFNSSSLLAIRTSPGQVPTADDIAWRCDSQVPTMPSPILVNERIYMVSDTGIASCLNALTGEELWQERLKGEFSASPIFAAGHLYFANRTGQVFVVRPGDQYQLVATNSLPAGVMATPVAVEKQLLIRTKEGLLSIERDRPAADRQ